MMTPAYKRAKQPKDELGEGNWLNIRECEAAQGELQMQTDESDSGIKTNADVEEQIDTGEVRTDAEAVEADADLGKQADAEVVKTDIGEVQTDTDFEKQANAENVETNTGEVQTNL